MIEKKGPQCDYPNNVKSFLKTTAMAVLVALSFGVLVEAYFCPEERSQAGIPAECCLQCCPRHHLAPPTINLKQPPSEPLYENFLIAEFTPYLVLFPDSVFHPPRA